MINRRDAEDAEGGEEERFFGWQCFNPVSGIQLAKHLLLLQPAKIIVAFIWASLHNRDAPAAITICLPQLATGMLGG
ncbi:MAG: hypothetical protein KME26_11925 [Oscillatoria princeps RMCB-10]|jgi:hypothetical protein|nr:hypothetical protein [Oscillatoria princeps RMCB-10]